MLAGLGIFLYILGLLSVNGYLLTFGITDFGLIRTRFIYTGALIVTSALLCAFPLVLRPLRQEAWPGIKRDLDGVKKKEAESVGFHRWKYRALRVTARLLVEIAWTLLVIAVLILPAWMIYNLPLQQFSPSDYARITGEPRDLTPTIARMAATVLIYGAGLLNAWLIRKGVRKARKAAVEARMRNAPYSLAVDIGVEASLSLTVVVLYCIIFMTVVYPVVPQQYGGGRPQRVSLLFKDDAPRGLQQVRVPLRDNARQVSAPLDLVHETDDVYVIRLSNGQVLRIDRELVSAVVNED